MAKKTVVQSTEALAQGAVAAAVAGDTIKIQVTYQTGDVATIDLVLNGYYADEASQADTVQMFGIKGQQSGDAVFTKVA